MQPNLSILFSNIAHLLVHMLIMLFPTLVLVLEHEWGMSYGELIALMFVGQILFGLGALPAGWLADRWSSVGMMCVFLIGTGGSAVLTGLANDAFGLGAGFALMGLFAAIYHPVGIPWVIRIASRRGRALGVNAVYGSLGFALAPIVGGALAETISWRAAFIVPGAFAILVGALLLALWRRGTVVDAVAEIQPVADAAMGSVRRPFLLLTIAMVCAGLVGHTLFLMMPKLVAEGLSAGASSGIASVGVLVAIAYLLGGLSGLVGGRLADRFPARAVYGLSLALFAALLFAAGMLGGNALVVVALLSAILNGLYPAAENLLLARFSPGKWRSTAFGVRSMFTLGSSAASVPLIAFMHERFGGFSALLLLLGSFAGIAVLAAQLLPGEGRRTARRSAADPAPTGR